MDGGLRAEYRKHSFETQNTCCTCGGTTPSGTPAAPNAPAPTPAPPPPPPAPNSGPAPPPPPPMGGGPPPPPPGGPRLPPPAPEIKLPQLETPKPKNKMKTFA